MRGPIFDDPKREVIEWHRIKDFQVRLRVGIRVRVRVRVR